MLKLENVLVSFPFSKGKELTVLQNMNLHVKKGELVALLGPSGCGKTTVLNVLAGQIIPVSGTAFVDHKPVKGLSSSIGYISQADTLLPWRTVLDNTALGLELRGVSKAERRERAAEVLRAMGLEGFENSYPSELSGGMKKRASIARTLAVDPEILMMDEPFAPLDAITRENLQNDILNLWERKGQTILYVTHDITEAIALADRVILMGSRPGRILKEYSIELERPRKVMEVKLKPEFTKLERQIWEDLRRCLGQENLL